MLLLDRIKKPNDIKRIPEYRLNDLASEIRHYLIGTVSRSGGHLAANLGVVELTIALHRVYDLPKDKIIWDVGHQSYTHKILTGRKEAFRTLRRKDGLSGFPRREESDCDSFDTGHSSTSISAGLGYVKARDLAGKDYKVVSVIGDGAFTGGMAFEALNNAAGLKTNFVVVLNDNEMSISRNVGGLSDYLTRIRTSSRYTEFKLDVSSALEQIPIYGERIVNAVRRTKSSIKQLFIPGMFFEDIGLTYLGPVDGHDIRKLTRVLRVAKEFKGPVIVHTLTQKGRGYPPAANDPSRYHGTPSFVIRTGEPVKESRRSYTDVFSDTIVEIAKEHQEVVAVTAAMKGGVGLGKFASLFPNRFFDVGIAEGHGVTFSAGLSRGGLLPVFAVYSSFLQRGFDQLMMDICQQDLHVIFAVDRAGLVGEDGKTHQGCFDLSYLSLLPGMTVMAPKNGAELREMLKAAVSFDGPVAIRYPRGEACREFEDQNEPIRCGKMELLKKGSKTALIAVGTMVREAAKAAEMLAKDGIDAALVNARFVKPLDMEMLRSLADEYDLLVTLEENVLAGGFGEHVLRMLNGEQRKAAVETIGIRDCYIRHASVPEQRKLSGLDAASVYECVKKRLLTIGEERGR